MGAGPVIKGKNASMLVHSQNQKVYNTPYVLFFKIVFEYARTFIASSKEIGKFV